MLVYNGNDGALYGSLLPFQVASTVQKDLAEGVALERFEGELEPIVCVIFVR